MEFFTILGLLFFGTIAYHMVKSFFNEPKVIEKIVYKPMPLSPIEKITTPSENISLRNKRTRDLADKWKCHPNSVENHYITYSGVIAMSDNQREEQIIYLRNQSQIKAIEQGCHPYDTEAGILCKWLVVYNELEKLRKKKTAEKS